MIKTVLAIVCLATTTTWAAEKMKESDNSKVATPKLTAPNVLEEKFLTTAQIHKMASVTFKAEAKRRPSASVTVATEDMLSPQYVEFRNKIVEASTGEQFYEIIKDYDSKYDAIPASATDLKFAVARLATWLPFRGITWRMTPMIHDVVVTQQVLLGTIRNWAEQAAINFPDSHVEAQLLFLSMPLVETDEKTGKQSFGIRFEKESDFIRFLGTDVYRSVSKAVKRLEDIPNMSNVGLKGGGNFETPVVFDARIRFGEDAFGDNYDAADRFKVMGEAERFAALARLSRRLSAISSMNAYNWNGHLAARRAIGKEFGIAAAGAALFDLTGAVGNEYVSGATRERRVQILNGFKNLYTLNNGGESWMKLSYFHLHRSTTFLDKVWDNVKNGDMGYVAQLDPEVFTARREQIEMAVANLKKLAGKCGDIMPTGCDPKVDGTDTIVGAISGDRRSVNLKGFYENTPPKDLKKLLPTQFARNEELDPLKKLPLYKNIQPASNSKPDVLKMRLNGEETTFRNYLYGRATGWNNTKDGYGVVFPGVTSKGVADAMRVINETRGARTLSNAFSMFIR